MRIRSSRVTAVALATAVALTSLDLAPASAADAAANTQATKTSSIDLSARRRHLRRGDAFMLGAVASVFGAIAATAAARRYRERYYYYGEGPYYYGSYGYDAPYAYVTPRAYGPSSRFHGRHHGQRGQAHHGQRH